MTEEEEEEEPSSPNMMEEATMAMTVTMVTWDVKLKLQV
jgi:hypothetical protein